jgi:hypothetical protein
MWFRNLRAAISCLRASAIQRGYACAPEQFERFGASVGYVCWDPSVNPARNKAAILAGILLR